jgi:hypothetical protein
VPEKSISGGRTYSLIKTVQQPQDAILQATIDSTRPALAP